MLARLVRHARSHIQGSTRTRSSLLPHTGRHTSGHTLKSQCRVLSTSTPRDPGLVDSRVSGDSTTADPTPTGAEGSPALPAAATHDRKAGNRKYHGRGNSRKGKHGKAGKHRLHHGRHTPKTGKAGPKHRKPLKLFDVALPVPSEAALAQLASKYGRHPVVISNSRLATWESCALRYYFKYELRALPSTSKARAIKSLPKEPAAITGELMHDVAATMGEVKRQVQKKKAQAKPGQAKPTVQDEAPKKNQVVKEFKKKWKKKVAHTNRSLNPDQLRDGEQGVALFESKASEEQALEEAVAQVEQVYDQEIKVEEDEDGIDTSKEVGGVEWPFEHTITFEDNPGYTLTGAVDRIEKDAEGNVVIIEYKTRGGRNADKASELKPWLKARYRAQAEMYAFAYFLEHNIIPSRVEIRTLGEDDSKPLSSYKVGPRTLFRVETRLRTMADMIRSPHIPSRPGASCHNLCPYVNFCPHAPADGTFGSPKAPGHNVKSWYVHKAPHSVQVDVRHLEATHTHPRLHQHQHEHVHTEDVPEQVVIATSAENSAELVGQEQQEQES